MASRTEGFVKMIFVLCSLLLWGVGHASGTGVVTLTDATFEHQTQAATGQTTGVWFVAFAPAGNARAARLAPVWEAAAASVQTSNPELIFAEVDTFENAQLRRRFGKDGLLNVPPALLLFRNRQLYAYKGPFEEDALVAFATTAYTEQATGRAVPPEASMLQVLLDDVSEQWKILTDGISHSSDPAFAKFLLVLAAVLTIVVLIATCAALCPSNPKPTTPTKKRK